MKRKIALFAAALTGTVLLFVTCSKDNPVAAKESNHVPVFTTTFHDTAFGKSQIPSSYTITLKAMDEDNDNLTYSIVSGPAGLAIGSASGVVTWAPTAAVNATVVVSVSDGKGGSATLTWEIAFLNFIKNTAPLTVLNVNDAYFLFRTPYVDTLWATAAGLTYSILQGPDSMKITPVDSIVAAVITWTYPDSHATSQRLDTMGLFTVKIRVTDGTTSDTLSWQFHVNTQPYPLTSQYQMPYNNYQGNTYLDTMTVLDDEGDMLTFSISDPNNLGITNTNIVRMGDTTLYMVQFTANTVGSFPVTITMTDPFGMDTTLKWTAKVSPKVMLLSQPEFMKSSVGIDSQYTDTIEIFPEYAGTVAFTKLLGPTGLTVNAQGILSWHPTAADSELVSIELVRGSNLEKDTLTWTVKAVGITKYVFWDMATTNGYHLQDCGPGPCLPAGVTVLEGTIGSWNTRLGTSDNDTGFAIGNGFNDVDHTNPASGRSAMIWSNDLCNMTGTVVRAVVRGELRDGFSGNSFVHSGRITMKVGVIDLVVYRDLAAPLGFGGTIPCGANWKGGAGVLGNPWSYDMQFYYKPGNPPVSYPGLMAEQIVTIQAPAGRPDANAFSVEDGKFFDLDVTPQVQWILDRKGKDYVQTTAAGDYAIVFLVANDATLGGEGKVNMYSEECATPSAPALGTGSDTPWTQDGNSMHFYIEGNLVPAN